MTKPLSPSFDYIRACLIWAMLIPQILLISLNVYSWQLVEGDANSTETQNALLLLLAQLFTLIFFSSTLALLWKKIASPSALLAFTSLCIHIGYFFLFLFLIDDIIPSTTQAWILDEENVGRWNITLMMPGAFLSLYSLSKGMFKAVPEQKTQSIALSFILGAPALWYVFVSIKQPTWLGQTSIVIWIIVAVCIVVVFLAAFIRLIDSIARKEFTQGSIRSHYVIAVILGLVAPISGMALNESIPFPANLQSASMYALTIFNGLVLVLKPGLTPFMHAKVFLRFATFPFITYIFLVFLPFLPLSLFAILALGVGFLMLTPLALGLFQWNILRDDYHQLKNIYGPRQARSIALTGLLVLPGYFCLQALTDKHALDSTLNYFYSHDTSAKTLSHSDISRSKNTLIQLRDRKENIQLPYISGMYNRLVFGNMVLSDTKIAQTYYWLSNQELPPQKNASFFGGTNNRNNWSQRRNVPPKRDISVKSASVRLTTSTTTRVHLHLENNQSDTHSLYLEKIHLPEGVFITDLRLKIDDTWVDGRIFDKKTALWVFGKITEFRRDPAIIYYTSPTQIELRVYPFPNKGTRELEIEFSFHPALSEKIQFGEHIVTLNPDAKTNLAIGGTNNNLLLDTNTSEWTYTREPYLHFILDYSEGRKRSPSEYIADIQRLSKKFNIDKVSLSAANLSSSQTSSDLVLAHDTLALTQAIKQIELPEQAGFWCEQALAYEIQNLARKPDAHRLKYTPILIMLHNTKNASNYECNYTAAHWQLPDADVYFSYGEGQLVKYPIVHNDTEDTNLAGENGLHTPAVIAVSLDKHLHFIRAQRTQVLPASIESAAVFLPNQARFSPLITSDSRNTKIPDWQRYADIWREWKFLNPKPSQMEAKRSHFLELSRVHRLVLPTSAMIVVEQASQWEILNRKEQQSMKNHSALDFEDSQDTPEPHPLILLLCAMAFFSVASNKTLRKHLSHLRVPLRILYASKIVSRRK